MYEDLFVPHQIDKRTSHTLSAVDEGRAVRENWVREEPNNFRARRACEACAIKCLHKRRIIDKPLAEDERRTLRRRNG